MCKKKKENCYISNLVQLTQLQQQFMVGYEYTSQIFTQ